MPFYNFKRKVKFYVVVGGLKYLVDIYPDVSFSQTFNESSRKVKTLHTQTNMFEAAIINDASPANFNFTMPLYQTEEIKPVLNLLLDYAANTSEVTLTTADIYVDTGVDIFKLEKAVFQRGSFNISKGAPVTVSISGSAAKLVKFGISGTTIPGTLQSTTSSSSTFLETRYMLVQINSITQDYVMNVSIEVTNDVQWLPNNTIHKSLAVTGPSDTTYPEGFVVSGRSVTGSIEKYLTDTNKNDANTWAISVPLRVRIGRTLDSYAIDFNLPEVVYTNRIASEEVFSQTYDFRMTSNPVSLSTTINYASPPAVITPILYVGGKTVDIIDSSSTNTTISLTDLVGGLATQPAIGDHIILAYSNSSVANDNLSVITSGYTEIIEPYVNDADDVNLSVNIKKFTSTETSVVVGPTGFAGRPGAVAIQVWRNVNPTKALDVAYEEKIAIDNPPVTPPKIYPMNTGAKLIVIAAKAGDASLPAFGNDLDNFIQEQNNSSVDHIRLGMGSKNWTSGIYTPGTWTGGGAPDAGSSMAAVTLALRPIEGSDLVRLASYWKVEILSSNGGSYVGAKEIELRGTAGGLDLTGSGTVLASSSYSGLPAINAFDNNNSTEWANNNIGFPEFIGYQFPTEVDINEILWNPRAGLETSQAPTAINVKYSTNGVDYFTYWSVTGIVWSSGQIKTFTKP